MYKIISKKQLNPTVTQMEIHAPLVANKALPGQFIILRVDESGERIPLTIAGVNKADGTVKIIFQIVGSTTFKLNQKNENDYIPYFEETRRIYEQIKAKNIPNTQFDVISMGMSESYRVAARCGSTLVRVGGAVFGKRA